MTATGEIGVPGDYDLHCATHDGLERRGWHGNAERLVVSSGVNKAACCELQMRVTDNGYSDRMDASVGQIASVAGVNNYNADALIYGRKTAVIANV